VFKKPIVSPPTLTMVEGDVGAKRNKERHKT
jgi:hypothetical protein